jgi:hypothetical protein
MRKRVCAAVVLSALAGSELCTVSARAEGEGTWVVIPGRRDVPPTCGCGVVVAEPVVVPVEPFLLVNKRPILSGPGHYLQGIGPYVPVDRQGPPAGAYPYVGFVYSGYPYGLQNSGGYPRGSYSPFTGYPYGDPPPTVVYRYHGARRYPHYPR